MIEPMSKPELSRLVRLISLLTELHPRTVQACLLDSAHVNRSTQKVVSQALPRAQEILREHA